MKSIFWLSPILKLILTTSDAVSDGYNEKYIKDPGHTVIKYLDTIVIIIAWCVAALIFFPSLFHYANTSNNLIMTLSVLFFPYVNNVYIAILLYLNSILLSIYNTNRKNIIRKVNEKNKAW